MKASEVLLAAADQIRTYGWCQGDFNTDGRVATCVLGATYQAGRGWAAEKMADDFVRKVVGWRALGLWNDHPGRTVDEVLEALHAAALLAEADGQ